MAEQKSRLVIEISAENAAKNISMLEKELNSLSVNGELSAKKLKKLGDDANSGTGKLDSLARSVKQLTASFVSFQMVQGAVAKADAFTGFENRLKLVTKSQGELNAAMDETYKIAQRSRGSWDGTIQVYQRFAQNADAIGLSMKEVARVTETVQKAVALSGASAGAAEAAMIQLGQAMASGVLRGDEFNSIAEQTPAIMDALAKGLNVTRGELRAMAADGKLTADVVAQAMLSMSSQVDADFAKTKATVGQAFASFSDSATKFIGELDKSTGATAAFAEIVLALGKNVDALAFGAATAGGIAFGRMLLANRVAIMAKTASLFTMNGALAATSALMTGPAGLAIAAIAAAGAYAYLRKDTEETTKALREQSPVVGELVKEYEKLNEDGKARKMKELSEKIKESEQALKDARKAMDGWGHIPGVNDVIQQFKDGKISVEELSTELLNNSQASEKTRQNIVKYAETVVAAKDNVDKYGQAQRALNGDVSAMKESAERADSGIKKMESSLSAYVESAKKARAEILKLNETWNDSAVNDQYYDKFRQKGYNDYIAKGLSKAAAAAVTAGMDEASAQLKAFEAYPQLKQAYDMQQKAQAWRDKDSAAQRSKTQSIKEQNKELSKQSKELEKQAKYLSPYSGNYRISSEMSKARKHPVLSGVTRAHNGVDVAMPSGTPIKAMADGVITNHSQAGGKKGYGHYIKIQYDDGSSSLIAHLSKFLAKSGQRVKAGEAVALSGNSGTSSGAHAHIEHRDAKGRLMDFRKAVGQKAADREVNEVQEKLNQLRLEEEATQKRINDEYSKFINQQMLAADLIGVESESERLILEMRRGAYAEMSQAQRDAMVAATKTRENAEKEFEVQKKYKELLDETVKRDNADFSDQLFELELIGKTSQEIQLLALARERDKQIQEAINAGASIETVEGLRRQKEAVMQATVEMQRYRDVIGSDWQGGLLDGVTAWTEKMPTLREGLAGLAESGIDGLTDSLANLATTGKASFKDFAASLAKDISKLMIKMFALWAIQKAVGMFSGGGASLNSSWTDASGGYTGLLAQAKGGAWLDGVQMFASGGAFTNGVVKRPTMFAHRGGLGVMGEAGAEAIMPLTRTSDGKLGITAQVGSSGGMSVGNMSVNVVINKDGSTEADAESDAEWGKQLAAAIPRMIEEWYVKNVARPGATYSKA